MVPGTDRIHADLKMQCCGSGQFFSGSVSTDPVLKIRIRVTPKRPDPTGSGSVSGSYLGMFFMFSKISTKFMAFLNQIVTSYWT